MNCRVRTKLSSDTHSYPEIILVNKNQSLDNFQFLFIIIGL